MDYLLQFSRLLPWATFVSIDTTPVCIFGFKSQVSLENSLKTKRQNLLAELRNTYDKQRCCAQGLA